MLISRPCCKPAQLLLQGNNGMTASDIQQLFPPPSVSARSYQMLAKAIEKPQARRGLPPPQGQPGIGKLLCHHSST